jgi:hypothetical protein
VILVILLETLRLLSALAWFSLALLAVIAVSSAVEVLTE